MKVEVRTRSIRDAKAAESYVRRRVPFAFGRLEHTLRDVMVVVEDVNGPRGGIDKRCLVKLEHKYGGAIVVRRIAPTIHEAVDRGLARGSQALQRILARAVRSRRPRNSGRRLDSHSALDPHDLDPL